jgi:SnoaL-like domain
MTQRSSATDLGTGLVAALAERDFSRFAETLTPDVRMRALIPPGPIELSGADTAAAKFSSWFADAEEFELIRSGSDTVADRLHVFYRLRVKKPGDQTKIVEQHLLCALDEGRITALDLVCTGFRPDKAGAHRSTSTPDLKRD